MKFLHWINGSDKHLDVNSFQLNFLAGSWFFPGFMTLLNRDETTHNLNIEVFEYAFS